VLGMGCIHLAGVHTLWLPVIRCKSVSAQTRPAGTMDAVSHGRRVIEGVSHAKPSAFRAPVNGREVSIVASGP